MPRRSAARAVVEAILRAHGAAPRRRALDAGRRLGRGGSLAAAGSPATKSTYCSPNESMVRRHAHTLFGLDGRSKTTRRLALRWSSTARSARRARRTRTARARRSRARRCWPESRRPRQSAAAPAASSRPPRRRPGRGPSPASPTATTTRRRPSLSARLCSARHNRRRGSAETKAGRRSASARRQQQQRGPHFRAASRGMAGPENSRGSESRASRVEEPGARFPAQRTLRSTRPLPGARRARDERTGSHVGGGEGAAPARDDGRARARRHERGRLRPRHPAGRSARARERRGRAGRGDGEVVDEAARDRARCCQRHSPGRAASLSLSLSLSPLPPSLFPRPRPPPPRVHVALWTSPPRPSPHNRDRDRDCACHPEHSRPERFRATPSHEHLRSNASVPLSRANIQTTRTLAHLGTHATRTRAPTNKCRTAPTSFAHALACMDIFSRIGPRATSHGISAARAAVSAQRPTKPSGALTTDSATLTPRVHSTPGPPGAS